MFAFKNSHIKEDMIERSTTDPFSLWWSLLLGLSTRVADARLQVRLRALETLQNVLCQYCNTIFTPKDWSIIFKSILFPLMDNVNKDITRQHVSRWPAENKFITTADSNSWIGTMGFIRIEIRFRTDRLQRIHLCCSRLPRIRIY